MYMWCIRCKIQWLLNTIWGNSSAQDKWYSFCSYPSPRRNLQPFLIQTEIPQLVREIKGITAPSSCRAEYVQDDTADIAIHETPRRAQQFHPDLDARIALSSEDHIEAACHITELEVGDDQTEVYLNLLCYFMLAIQSFYQNQKMNYKVLLIEWTILFRK